MLRNYLILTVTLILGLQAFPCLANDPDDEKLAFQFQQSVLPFLKSYCLECHGAEDPEAKFDLSNYSSVRDIASAHQIWEIVLKRISSNEMPPEDSEVQPSAQQRKAIIEWIQAVRKHEADKNSGDPGPVLARRLNNQEYNYTIRDLTGVDIRPTATFPIDPANEAGFDNSGESLSMSPALLNKYLEASRQVVEHMVLTPSGITFAPHPVVTNTDRDKYCVNRIVEFYKQQPTDLADYFQACWSIQKQPAGNSQQSIIQEVAAKQKISPKYLRTVWNLLHRENNVGPIAKLQTLWQELPDSDEKAARSGSEAMRDYVVDLRLKLQPKIDTLSGAGVHKGSQTLVLWRNEQYASQRRTFNHDLLTTKTTPLDIPTDKADLAFYQTELEYFCQVFPNIFYVSERGRDYVSNSNKYSEEGRLLSAGFHSMMGYYRDDSPLYELILDESEKRDLDRLWQELDFITSAPTRQYSSFLWFERTDSTFIRDPDFDFARAEDKSAANADMIERLSKVYLAKIKREAGDALMIQAAKDYFHNINDQIRWVEQARIKAAPLHLSAVLQFCQRAFRRPLTKFEQQDIKAFYHELRSEYKLNHEQAIQDTVVSVLMSPHFSYRLDLGAARTNERPLTNLELASRLSYFMWSSMPDQELLQLAESGKLSQPDVLLAQTERMLQDPRVFGLATEFGGQWLDIRQFQDHNSVDRDRFPAFTNELRQAMFEEPIRFLVDVFQQDRSITSLLNANHTFVNRELAQHYGIDHAGITSTEWTRIDDASQYGRGGLLPMSVFLTKNSPGLRTSPVKRGYWVVRRILGEEIPPPPPEVPELPADESKLGDLSLREMLAKHRQIQACAGCHDRFDAVGLVFEQYGPVGEFRELDLGGRPVDASAEFPDGSLGEGLAGLRRYLNESRIDEFQDNLCEKLLSYGLGRTLLPSDDSLLKTMRERLKKENARIGCLIESIVTSPQFLNKRGNEANRQSANHE
ncbi:MAG: hypothetical protein COA78_20590 [Blastopirellula sp.]|nr:MAG: hypothetical protein COA78_20590 [Blastopirellula sp.]